MNRIGEALCAALATGGRAASSGACDTLTRSEWHAVAALARQQRVGPLLSSRNPPCPDDVRAVLRAGAEASSCRALMHKAAYRELTAAATARGISLVALKGLHLATTMYASPGLREMNDIDVLVRPDQVAALSDVARELGYRPLREVPVPVALKVGHHLPRFRKNLVSLEVHWRLGPPGSEPRVEPGELWALTAPFPQGAGVSLVPEALLVHVCAHAAMHHFEQGLRPLCDVQAILRRPSGGFTWPLMLHLARRWQCERSVALVLSLSHDTLGVEVPEAVMHSLAAHRPSAGLRRLALTHTLSDVSQVYDTPPAAGQLLSTPGVRGKVQHVWTHVWLPASTMAFLYPSAGTGPVARAVIVVCRAVGLVRRHAPGFFRLATRGHAGTRSALDRRNTLAAWLRQR